MGREEEEEKGDGLEVQGRAEGGHTPINSLIWRFWRRCSSCWDSAWVSLRRVSFFSALYRSRIHPDLPVHFEVV